MTSAEETRQPTANESNEAPAGTKTSEGAARLDGDFEYIWSTYGIVVVTGVVGAAIVAITFLFIDLLSGRPALWTPAVLGSALFLGEAVGESAAFRPTDVMHLVLGYTLVHGVAFIGFASAMSAGRLTHHDHGSMTLASTIRVALVMFVGLEIFFLGMGWIVGREIDLIGRLGSVSVAAANALASMGMALTLAHLMRKTHDALEGEAAVESGSNAESALGRSR